MRVDPDLERALRERIDGSTFRKWMGFELVSIDDGASEIRLAIRPHHLNPGGVVHGGVLATLLDSAIGLALRTKLGADQSHATLELTVHYLEAARQGTLVARAWAVQGGRRASYGEAELRTEDGRLVAKGSARYLALRRPATPAP